MKRLEVVAAIIIFEGKILCMQRAAHSLTYLSDKFEFPGGKVEAGESPEQALIREIAEELEMDITIQEEYCRIEHSYPDFEINLICFTCTVRQELHQLCVHQHSIWMYPEDLNQLDWAAADIPAVQLLMNAQ